MGAAIEAMEREEAKKRKEAGKSEDGVGGRGNKKPSSNLDEGSEPHARRSDTRTAEAVGMRKDSYRKAKEIVAAAEAEPEKYAHLVEKIDPWRKWRNQTAPARG
ncbi:MAG TPA: hypothetical protein VN688_12410 [Gemmataceae bacterium]|nr:hypothetical protein [Gemmataceae bacterium]